MDCQWNMRMSNLGNRILSHKRDVEQRPSGRRDEQAAAAALDQIVEPDRQRTIGAVLRAHAEVRPEQGPLVASQFALRSGNRANRHRGSYARGACASNGSPKFSAPECPSI